MNTMNMGILRRFSILLNYFLACVKEILFCVLISVPPQLWPEHLLRIWFQVIYIYDKNKVFNNTFLGARSPQTAGTKERYWLTFALVMCSARKTLSFLPQTNFILMEILFDFLSRRFPYFISNGEHTPSLICSNRSDEYVISRGPLGRWCRRVWFTPEHGRG